MCPLGKLVDGATACEGRAGPLPPKAIFDKEEPEHVRAPADMIHIGQADFLSGKLMTFAPPAAGSTAVSCDSRANDPITD